LQQIKNILKGNLTSVIQHFKTEMNELAADLKFEQAALVKGKIDHLENYQAKSVIVSKHLSNIDVFSILRDNDIAFVNYLMVQNGTIVQTHTVQLKIQLEENNQEVLAFAIANLRADFNSLSHEIVVPFDIDYPDETVTITVPKAGDKKQLLDLSLKNVNYFTLELKKKKYCI
jgi:excinuclease ABC subunit C